MTVRITVDDDDDGAHSHSWLIDRYDDDIVLCWLVCLQQQYNTILCYVSD